ncbi:hypothetical protein ABT150_46745 [Streptomyces mirabilis]|uniref:hypothetical protein n=1 Tax=Streptomyces mirabilis TaxID=68239 RepID=UPI00331D0844
MPDTALPPTSDETIDAATAAIARQQQLTRRLIAPLLRAGWEDCAWEVFEEDDYTEHTLQLDRSNFHIQVSWCPGDRTLRLSDPELEWFDDRVVPPMFPLDEDLVLKLPDAPEHVQAETARRAFATAGLLDPTRIHLPRNAGHLRVSLLQLLMEDTFFQATRDYRAAVGKDGAMSFDGLGEDFDWRIAAGLRAYPLVVPGPVPSSAALGIAEWCWRRESDVEGWHRKVTDLEMARANIAATRAVLPHVHQEGVDWPAVRLALTAPGRRLASGSALADLFEEGWQPVLQSIHREIDRWCLAEDRFGPQAVLQMLSLHGSRTESIGTWWGSGWYESAVRVAVDHAATNNQLPHALTAAYAGPEQFADAVVHGPDLLDDDTLLWAIEAVHDEECRRRGADQPVPTAVTLPDWAADQLTALLAEDDD